MKLDISIYLYTLIFIRKVLFSVEVYLSDISRVPTANQENLCASHQSKKIKVREKTGR